MKVGVLGMGSIGRRHARNLVTLGHEVFGYDPVRKESYDGVYPKYEDVHMFGSRKQLLDTCDAIIIASPNEFHANDLADSINHGRHVFVEKPIGTAIHKRLQTTLKSAEDRKLVVFTGYNLRFHHCVTSARMWLPRLGKKLWASVICGSYMPDWVPDVDYRKRYSSKSGTGGAVLDISHEIDLTLHLMGAGWHVTSSMNRSGRLEIDCEDMADIILSHRDGSRSNIHIDYLCKPDIRRFTIVCEGGTYEADLLTRNYSVVDRNGNKLEKRVCNDTFDENYVTEMRDFIARIESGHTGPGATGNDGMAALRVCMAVKNFGIEDTK